MPDIAPNLAPRYEIQIAGSQLGPDVTRFVESVTYESADGLADMVKLQVSNPDFIFSDVKLFQPGNEVDLAIGYGEVTHIGSAEIVRNRPSHPSSGMPMLEVTAYTRDFLMMDNSPEKGKARFYKDATLRDILEDKAGVYGFDLDIDDFSFGRTIKQKPGLSDYDFVKGLSNLTGFLFWVDAPIPGKWTLHFRNPGPKGDAIEGLQDKKFTFRYARGDFSTLLEFEPEYAITGAKTKIKVDIREPVKGETISEEFEDTAEAPDAKSSGDPSEMVEDSQTTAGALRIFFNEFAIDTITDKVFKSTADAQRWAEQWFRRNRQNFVMGRGKTIGVESVFARQVHTLDGLGAALNGDYYFTRVQHVLSRDSGYFLDFSARKVLP